MSDLRARVAVQTRLVLVPIAACLPVGIDEANRLLVAWGHKLGACHRPFRQEAYALEIDGRPVSVAISASTVSNTIVGAIGDQGISYRRDEVVELARLCSDPAESWASRVMLRLWRQLLAQRWDCWPVKAAISYSHNAMHKGDLYRFDGWEKIKSDAGTSGGGGAWSRSRYAADVVKGAKSLWLWRYP